MQQVQRPSQPVPTWLSKNNGLFTAALQRFWLDDITDWLLVKPIHTIAKEVQYFDEKVVDRITGIPSHANMVNTLSHWEARKQGKAQIEDTIGKGSGLFGSVLEWLGSTLQWLEERFILKGSGEGLLKTMDFAGKYLEVVDKLLTQPRYIFVLIIATFVVV